MAVRTTIGEDYGTPVEKRSTMFPNGIWYKPNNIEKLGRKNLANENKAKGCVYKPTCFECYEKLLDKLPENGSPNLWKRPFYNNLNLPKNPYNYPQSSYNYPVSPYRNYPINSNYNSFNWNQGSSEPRPVLGPSPTIITPSYYNLNSPLNNRPYIYQDQPYWAQDSSVSPNNNDFLAFKHQENLYNIPHNTQSYPQAHYPSRFNSRSMPSYPHQKKFPEDHYASRTGGPLKSFDAIEVKPNLNEDNDFISGMRRTLKKSEDVIPEESDLYPVSVEDERFERRQSDMYAVPDYYDIYETREPLYNKKRNKVNKNYLRNKNPRNYKSNEPFVGSLSPKQLKKYYYKNYMPTKRPAQINNYERQPNLNSQFNRHPNYNNYGQAAQSLLRPKPHSSQSLNNDYPSDLIDQPKQFSSSDIAPSTSQNYDDFGSKLSQLFSKSPTSVENYASHKSKKTLGLFDTDDFFNPSTSVKNIAPHKSEKAIGLFDNDDFLRPSTILKNHASDKSEKTGGLFDTNDFFNKLGKFRSSISRKNYDKDSRPSQTKLGKRLDNTKVAAHPPKNCNKPQKASRRFDNSKTPEAPPSIKNVYHNNMPHPPAMKNIIPVVQYEIKPQTSYKIYVYGQPPVVKTTDDSEEDSSKNNEIQPPVVISVPPVPTKSQKPLSSPREDNSVQPFDELAKVIKTLKLLETEDNLISTTSSPSFFQKLLSPRSDAPERQKDLKALRRSMTYNDLASKIRDMNLSAPNGRQAVPAIHASGSRRNSDYPPKALLGGPSFSPYHFPSDSVYSGQGTVPNYPVFGGIPNSSPYKTLDTYGGHQYPSISSYGQDSIPYRVPTVSTADFHTSSYGTLKIPAYVGQNVAPYGPPSNSPWRKSSTRYRPSGPSRFTGPVLVPYEQDVPLYKNQVRPSYVVPADLVPIEQNDGQFPAEYDTQYDQYDSYPLTKPVPKPKYCYPDSEDLILNILHGARGPICA